MGFDFKVFILKLLKHKNNKMGKKKNIIKEIVEEKLGVPAIEEVKIEEEVIKAIQEEMIITIEVPEVKPRSINSLSRDEFRFFQRTGIIPK